MVKDRKPLQISEQGNIICEKKHFKNLEDCSNTSSSDRGVDKAVDNCFT